MKSRGLATRLLFFLCFFTLTFLGCGKSPGVVWRFQTGARIAQLPAISGDKLIVSSIDQHLYALDLQTGKQIWKTDFGTPVSSAPLAERDQAFVGDYEGYFYRIDSSTGKVLWKYKTGATIDCIPCSDQEGIYFGSRDSYFYKISRDGKLLWKFKTGFYVTSPCAIDKDMVYTASWDTNVYAIRRDNGEMVWKYPTGEYSYGGPIVVDNRVFYSSHKHFYGLDARTGKLYFELRTSYCQNVISDQKVLFSGEDGLTKRTLDGKLLANASFESFATFRPSLVPPYVIMSTTTKELIGFSTNTLERKWKFKADDLFYYEGVEHNGIYYIGNDNGSVYALRLPK